jgi:hypothetical protein
MMNYEIGHVVTYKTFGGGIRHVKVKVKEADIKNGWPGFAGKDIHNKSSVWGYDDQIIAYRKDVFKEEERQ